MTASNMGKAINSLASFIFSSFSRYPRSPSTVARMDLKIGPIEARETAGLPIDDYRAGGQKNRKARESGS